RDTFNDAAGFDVLGSRAISVSELSALSESLERIHFWELAPEEDLAAMAERSPEPPQQVVDGKVYTPNHPLTVVCVDSAIYALEVAQEDKVHAVYRFCDNDIDPVVNQIIDLAEPLLRRRQ